MTERMKSLVNVFNRFHFPITVGSYTFPPGEVTQIKIETTSLQFRRLRSTRGLRFGNPTEEWKGRHRPDMRYEYNMVYDTPSQRRDKPYVRVVEALANPILKHLPAGSAGFTERPGARLNLRFFSETRITETGKDPVGPNDVFMSHGIGDKNYWLAERIRQYSHALVPGPAWRDRIMKGGYKGKVWVTGYTKLDPVFQGEYERQKHDKPYVVWAPTHGYYHRHRGRSSYPQCLSLINEIPDEYETHLAMHPSSRLSHQQAQDVTLQELLDADVVIADAGSTLYEAWALGKPVIFPDWLCKADVLAHFADDKENLEYRIYDEQIGYHATDMKHLIKLIDVALRDGMQQRERDFIETVFPDELRGKAGKLAAEALMSIRER